MHLPFDILKKERDGSFRWFETVNDLGSANVRIRELIALSPGDYVVFDHARITPSLPHHQVSGLTPEGSEHLCKLTCLLASRCQYRTR